MQLEVMQSYFRGEKIEALFFIVPVGILLLAFAAVALKVERPAFAWGIAAPCILFGLILLVVGLSVGLRTDQQVAGLTASLASDPAAMASKELPRMQKVLASFELYVRCYGGLAVAGLLLRFALKAEWAHGLGAALVMIMGIGLLIDGFAWRRAIPYSEALTQLAASQPDKAISAPEPTASAASSATPLPASAQRALTAFEKGDWATLESLADEGIIPEHQLSQWREAPSRVGDELPSRTDDAGCTTYRFRSGPRPDAMVHELHLTVCDGALKSMLVFGW